MTDSTSAISVALAGSNTTSSGPPTQVPGTSRADFDGHSRLALTRTERASFGTLNSWTGSKVPTAPARSGSVAWCWSAAPKDSTESPSEKPSGRVPLVTNVDGTDVLPGPAASVAQLERHGCRPEDDRRTAVELELMRFPGGQCCRT